MRLFIAINFPTAVRQFLVEQQKKIEAISTKGTFSRKENLHLTLIFLGDILEETLPTIIKIIKEIQASPFPLILQDVGYFKRREGDLWWIGSQPNHVLQQLRATLYEQLTKAGFILDSKPFNAHITLARGVKLIHKGDSIVNEKLLVTVDRISLMESFNLNGTLIYRELDGKDLSKE